ncbi:MAG: hypothetical protein QOC81_1328 [Thermoanaerobaculia bacterium]|jgi:predicted RNase H-like HicB family nuclease|nr:hypothetical protein [Thermoanaerobaculia bacterium]
MLATLNAIFFDDDGGVSGFVEELIGVHGHGKNIKEARASLTKAAREFLAGQEHGMSERLSAYGPVTREKLDVEFMLGTKRRRPRE